MTESVAFIGVNHEIDFRQRHETDNSGAGILQWSSGVASTSALRNFQQSEVSDVLLPRGFAASAMKPPTDYIRHAARLARKLQMDASLTGTPQPDAEFYKALSKAFDEIAAGLEQVGKPD
jgi:hypothetical protein